MKLLQKSVSKNGRSSRGITRNDCKDIIAGEEVRANKNEQPRKGLLTNDIRDETPKSETANAASLLPRHNDGIKMCSLIFNGSNERILTPTPAYIINEVQSDGSGRESVKESKKISSKAEEKQQNRVLNRFVANYIEDFPPLSTTLRVSCYSYCCPALRMWPRFLWAAAKVWKRV